MLSFFFQYFVALHQVSQFSLWMCPAELMFQERIFVRSVVVSDAESCFADVFNVSFASVFAKKKNRIEVLCVRCYPGVFPILLFLHFPTCFIVVSGDATHYSVFE